MSEQVYNAYRAIQLNNMKDAILLEKIDEDKMCHRLDCQCDCDLEHDKCRQTACAWRIEGWLRSSGA